MAITDAVILECDRCADTTVLSLKQADTSQWRRLMISLVVSLDFEQSVVLCPACTTHVVGTFKKESP
jgi:hypothetical protein